MPDGTNPELEKPVENQLASWTYFPSVVYTIEKPEFLKAVNEVSEERLKVQKADKKIDPIYPVVMTDNLFTDPRMANFMEFVGATAWKILSDQGYAMDNLSTSFTEMWTQEHYKHSLMEQHVHGYGSQIVGFYFLETPENCSNVIFHDPRAGKVQIDLPEQDMLMATPASKMINFKPKPGMLVFANSWLPHSFGRHGSDEPLKFVHFNLIVQLNPNLACPAPAEVV